MMVSGGDVLHMDAGDTAAIHVYQDSGSARALHADDNYNHIAIAKVVS